LTSNRSAEFWAAHMTGVVSPTRPPPGRIAGKVARGRGFSQGSAGRSCGGERFFRSGLHADAVPGWTRVVGDDWSESHRRAVRFAAGLPANVERIAPLGRAAWLLRVVRRTGSAPARDLFDTLFRPLWSDRPAAVARLEWFGTRDARGPCGFFGSRGAHSTFLCAGLFSSQPSFPTRFVGFSSLLFSFLF
jgi:hypothetical protein